MTAFLAIDFETASPRRESACAIGLTRVEKGAIVEEAYYLIRPPEREFWFSHIHGITWGDVAGERDFAGLWPALRGLFDGVEFIAAHNAGFDRGVLNACCAFSGLSDPGLPYVCTVQLARRMWDLRPTKLPDVCNFLGLKLDHHQADSDARACAQIVIAAAQDGWRYEGGD